MRLTALLQTASESNVGRRDRCPGGRSSGPGGRNPETVLITGSLIRGTAAVGVPVVNLAPQDFAMTGSLTAADLFRSVPQFNVLPGPTALASANVERGIKEVNLRQLDTGSSPRSLMMIDGLRYPPQGNGLDQLDPSIIPQIAIERIDLLLDGASATYGSDAIAGVINIVLKRNFEGALVEAVYKRCRRQSAVPSLWAVGPDLGWRTNHAELLMGRQRSHSRKLPLEIHLRPHALGLKTGGRSVPRCRARSPPARRHRRTRPTPVTSAKIARTATPSRSGRAKISIRRQRHRSDGAVQCLDPELGQLQHGGQQRHQRHPQRLQPLLDQLVRRGHSNYRHRDDGRSAADQQRLVLRRGVLVHAPRDIQERTGRQPIARRGPDVQSLLPDRRTERPARRLQHQHRQPVGHQGLGGGIVMQAD